MGNRRRARELVLASLYRADVLNQWDSGFVEKPLAHCRDAQAVVDFVRVLLQGIVARRPEIDAAIETHADHWTVSRMTTVDRNIMRIAAFEILFCDDIPRKVSINEAVELAKRYSTTDACNFINAVLDKIGTSGT